MEKRKAIVRVMPGMSRDAFVALVERERGGASRAVGTLAVPIGLRLLSDQLTPVLAYRRLVSADERTAPSFLLESVEGGERVGRHSILGARPIVEVVAYERAVRVTDRRSVGEAIVTEHASGDPLSMAREITRSWRLVRPAPDEGGRDVPACVLGGWFGMAAYDSVRYAEPEKLPFEGAPADDRGLPDVHFGLYDGVVAFDHVEKLVYVVQLAVVGEGARTRDEIGRAYDDACERLACRVEQVQTHSRPLAAGIVGGATQPAMLASNITRERHAEIVAQALEYIRAGDIFQVVLGQRFEKRSEADPFDVYRALRAVNPSPYMVYMQCEGCILVAASPEILCRVRREEREGGACFVVTNRPLAGTRKRGADDAEDRALEIELLADPKERAEHVMLVDLGRNDVGVVARAGSIELPRVMEVERYSHVMHISSTVTGVLRDGLDAWDALRAALPVGTISGAPKVRAMQIIDELEGVKRGPYGGGMGYVGLDGQMDVCLALRTIVVPVAMRDERGWIYHVQAAGGIVLDSQPDAEFMETVNKAAAMGRAIELAERAFGGS
ncbi:MAG: chorismate-binding protein [Phycisphaerales bacterium]|nr:chorismate-binding protein [Phycisphaerales bacterium]